MVGLKSCMMVFMMMMVASMQMHSSMAQTRHVVGDGLGWTIPSNGAATYTSWAAQQNIVVGDTLVFNFTTGAHNVAQVSQAAYGPCTTANPISLTPTGPATLTVTTSGPHYYICTVGSHCQIGQKLTINVSTAAAAPTTPPPAATPRPTPTPAATPRPTPTPAATPTRTPAPASTPTSSPAPSPVDQASPPSPPTPGPSPSGSTSPPPSDTTPPTGSTTPTPPSNAAASFTTVAPATFLAVVLALFY